MAKKCTKIFNVRAQPLFYSLNFLFSGVLVTVAVVTEGRERLEGGLGRDWETGHPNGENVARLS